MFLTTDVKCVTDRGKYVLIFPDVGIMLVMQLFKYVYNSE